MFVSPKKRPTRVLVADDNVSTRKAIVSFLRDMVGIEVCAVTANGTEAVEAALVLKPELLIIDMVMPRLNGVEVVSILKKSLPDSKFILFTLFGDSVGKTLAKMTGVDVVLAKNEGLPVLAQKINSVIEEMGE